LKHAVMRDEGGAVMLTATQLRSMIRAKITVLCGRRQKIMASSIGVSESFLSDVLAGRREPTGKILDYLGYERVVSYRKLRS